MRDLASPRKSLGYQELVDPYAHYLTLDMGHAGITGGAVGGLRVVGASFCPKAPGIALRRRPHRRARPPDAGPPSRPCSPDPRGSGAADGGDCEDFERSCRK